MVAVIDDTMTIGMTVPRMMGKVGVSSDLALSVGSIDGSVMVLVNWFVSKNVTVLVNGIVASNGFVSMNNDVSMNEFDGENE
jgi:hypothetical protein